MGVFVFLGFLEAYGFGVPVGGSGKLTEALIRCIEDRTAASVLAGQEVREVMVTQRPRRRRHHRGRSPLHRRATR